MQSLTVGGIVAHAFIFGVRNAASLVAALFLWSLTVWIPYLNVGTTIGLLGLIGQMAQGKVVSPVEIFKSQYRQQMGDFILVLFMVGAGVLVASMFMILPGVVLGLTWFLATLLVVDEKLSPFEALKKSAQRTYGKKLIIFAGMAITFAAVGSAVALLVGLGIQLHWFVGGLFALVGGTVAAAINIGATAYIYGNLTGILEEERPVNQGMVLGIALGTITLASLLGAFILNSATQSLESPTSAPFSGLKDALSPSATTRKNTFREDRETGFAPSSEREFDESPRYEADDFRNEWARDDEDDSSSRRRFREEADERSVRNSARDERGYRYDDEERDDSSRRSANRRRHRSLLEEDEASGVDVAQYEEDRYPEQKRRNKQRRPRMAPERQRR